jgi:hypothetical protein
MKQSSKFGFLVLALALALVVAGCKDDPVDKTTKATDTQTQTGGTSTQPKEDPEVKASLDKLSREDQMLARAQRICPVSDEPLGSMDVPLKVTIEGQTVFLCCGGCKKDALANPEKTLAKVKELKEKAATGK